jgi:hypothetical protein
MRPQARVLGWSEQTVRRGVADGSIPSHPAGSHRRVKVAWLRAIAGSPEPAPEVPDEAGQQHQAIELLRSAVSERLDAACGEYPRLEEWFLRTTAEHAFEDIERLLRLRAV